MNNKKINAVKCPILCYHHFINDKIENMDCRTTGEKFEEDIKSLLAAGYTSISLERLYEYENDKGALPEKPFIISIDDGYLSNYEIAFPILRKYNVFADIFIITSFAGMDIHLDYPNFIPHFSFSKAQEMEKSGLVKIHSHGEWHIPNEDMDESKFSENINKSKQIIKDHSVKKFICYAYPNDSFNETTVDSVEECGYVYQMIRVDKLTVENIKKGCLGRVPVGYESNILNTIQIHSNYVTNTLRQRNIIENIESDDQRINKCGKFKAFLTDDLKKYNCSTEDYTIKGLFYTGVNIQRGEDDIVLYKGNGTTGTGLYGYEFIVENNIIIKENHTGNSVIPKNGFVISGHGSAGQILLNIYDKGINAFICEEEKIIFFIETPQYKIEKIISDFDRIKVYYENIKKSQFEYDIEKIEKKINKLQCAVDKIYKSYDAKTALQLLLEVKNEIRELQYLTIPHKSVENRAVWYRSVEKSDEEVRKIIERVKSLNVNAVYLETWYGGKYIGFSENPKIPHNYNFHGDFDALEAFCRIGHEYSVEIHAWVANFNIGSLEHAETEKDSLIKKTEGKHLLDSEGNAFNLTAFGRHVYLNPHDSECRKLILDLYREMIAKYDIDGLHLDYIRFPHLNYCKYEYGYNQDIIRDFQEKHNIAQNPTKFVKGTQEYQNWHKFRENIINSFVEEVYNMVRSQSKNIWLSCACSPDLKNAPATIFQNVSVWVENEWVDEVFSMSYTSDNEGLRKNIKQFKQLCGNKVLYSAGLSAFENNPENIFIDQFRIAREEGVDGIALFALGDINDKNYEKAIIKAGFREKSIQKEHKMNI